MKLKKKIPLIDQHDRYGFWGGKFGGSFIPETLKKPVEDLTKEFKKMTDIIDISGGLETNRYKDRKKIDLFLNNVNKL